MKVNNPNYLNGLTVSAEQINAAVEGGGAGLTTEQTAAIAKIEGLEATASEINNGIINYDETGTHVFILAGQSNMVGWDVFSNTKGDYPTGVMQVARTGGFSGGLNNELVQAVSPLDNYGSLGADKMGLSLQFVHNYSEMFPNVNIILIPCAAGGTGFNYNNWNKGDTYYEDMISRVNTLFVGNPDFKLKALLWHQGESDMSNVNYENDILTFFNDIRADISFFKSDTPIFIGGLVPSYIDSNSLIKSINSIIENLDKKDSYVFYTDSTYPYKLTNKSDELHHFDSEGLNNMGDRYFSTYLQYIEKNYKTMASIPKDFASIHNATFTGQTTNYGSGSIKTNTVYGGNSLSSNTTGKECSAYGVNSLSMNTIGEANSAFGINSLLSNTTGNSNTAIGANSLKNNTTGTNNTAIGTSALLSNTTGNNLLAIGRDSLALNNGGFDNLGIGNSVLSSNISGNNNIGIGSNSLNKNTASSNIAIGVGVLKNNTTGNSNTAIGFNSSTISTTSMYNTSIGMNSLRQNITGSRNTAVGSQSLDSSTGSVNTALGIQSGYGVTTGSGNITIGGLTTSLSFSPAYNITTENNYISMGSTAVTNAYIQVAWTVVSDERDKTDFDDIPHGLDFVSKLKPIKYKFRESRDSDVAVGDVKYGFKAQDILALEGDNSVIVDTKDSEKLRYTESNLIPILVKAIQELKAEIEILKSKA